MKPNLVADLLYEQTESISRLVDCLMQIRGNAFINGNDAHVPKAYREEFFRFYIIIDRSLRDIGINPDELKKRD